MNPSGKKAVVLGGTSGIGLATARQLMEAGAHVVVVSRSDSNAAGARETLGDSADIRQLDVLDRERMARLFEELAPFDILVNAATGGDTRLASNERPFSRSRANSSGPSRST